MSIKQLLEETTKNWPVKAACFVLAAMIYFFHQVSLLDSKTFSVPLEVKSEGSMMPVSGLENMKYVRVKVRTRREQIASVTENDFSAFVDISSQAKEGLYSFPVYVALDERIIQLDLEPLEISSQPDSVQIQVQKKSVKTVPLAADVLGEPAYGYRALSAELEPAYATVCGPSSMVDDIESLSAGSVDIGGAKETVSRTVKPVNMNSYISVIDGSLVRVSVPVVQEGTVRDFQGIPVSCTNLPEGFTVSGPDARIDIVIEGNLLDIEKISSSDIRAYADCGFIAAPGVYEVPVQIEVSKPARIAQQSVSVLTLTIVSTETQEQESGEQPSEGTGDGTAAGASRVPLLS
ncbi:MAG: hypothetical protein J6K96_09080 [Treponema sp.]|nr:hypothetical protein [Treponema sp.]